MEITLRSWSYGDDGVMYGYFASATVGPRRRGIRWRMWAGVAYSDEWLSPEIPDPNVTFAR